MNEKERKMALQGALLELTIDNLSSCKLTRIILKAWEHFERWLEEIPEKYRTSVEDLLINQQIVVFIDKYGDPYLTVNCSDTFVWGCSDFEDITFEELPDLIECYKLSPKWGGELWVARKRKMRPQGASYDECYPRSEWHLFDACGPARKAQLCDPVDRDKLNERETTLEKRNKSNESKMDQS